MDYIIYSKMDYLLESMENNEFFFQLAICKMIQWRIILKNPYIYIFIYIYIYIYIDIDTLENPVAIDM